MSHICVTEECVGSCGSHDDEIFRGKLFRVYTKSHFLEHLARDTGGHTETILHYKLTCLNHLIDVGRLCSSRGQTGWAGLIAPLRQSSTTK